MPAVSEAQRRAMAAASSGRSTLGIPAKVGKEFLVADKGGKLPAVVGSPKSRNEHMARRATVTTQANVGAEFAKHRTTVGRAMRQGFLSGGSAK